MFLANQRGCLRFVESKVSIRTSISWVLCAEESIRTVPGCFELKKIRWPTTVTAILNTSRRKQKTHGKNKKLTQKLPFRRFRNIFICNLVVLYL